MQHIHMLVGSTVPEPLGQYWIIVCVLEEVTQIPIILK